MMAAPQQTPPTAKVQIEHVQTLVDRVLMPMSPSWLVAIGIAVVISLFDLSRTADGAVEVRFGVSTVSALLIALVWLPFLLKAIVLGGGTVKLQPVETSLPGLLDLLSRLEPETQRQVLPAYIQSVEEAETKAPPSERAGLRELRRDLRGSPGRTGVEGEVV